MAISNIVLSSHTRSHGGAGEEESWAQQLWDIYPGGVVSAPTGPGQVCEGECI